ncbi:MAG: hypothetical protein JWQ97_993 [Phenylobacterium sp.]|nr:hypothetical protein [Phenylobacterium sp.]
MTVARCPTCRQPMPEPGRAVRRCYDCRKPIGRHHKWTWEPREGVITIVHRHCDNPTSYHPPGEAPVPPSSLFDGEAA